MSTLIRKEELKDKLESISFSWSTPYDDDSYEEYIVTENDIDDCEEVEAIEPTYCKDCMYLIDQTELKDVATKDEITKAFDELWAMGSCSKEQFTETINKLFTPIKTRHCDLFHTEVSLYDYCSKGEEA